MTAIVTVIGMVGQTLPPGAATTIAQARLVVGGRPALDAAGVAAGPEAFEVPGPGPLPAAALDALDAVVAADEPAVVLVTGDPGYFGVLRALRERGLPTACRPAVTPLQRLAALLGMPWDGVAVVSAHGPGFRCAVNVCRARPAVGVLTAPGAGPAELAAELAGWRRTLAVLADVGGRGEELSVVDAVEAAGRRWAEPNVVLCLSAPADPAPASWLAGGGPVPPDGGWALGQEAFSVREGTGSSPELRALALTKLAPRPGTLVWDVAAGSGTIGIEAARLGAAVIAVESDPGLCVRIVANAERHGVDVRLVDGPVPESLAGLPRPDAVYLGTTQPDAVRACAAVRAPRIVVEVHELGSIGPARDALVDSGYTVDGRLLSAAPVEGLQGGGGAIGPASSGLLLWGAPR